MKKWFVYLAVIFLLTGSVSLTSHSNVQASSNEMTSKKEPTIKNLDVEEFFFDQEGTFILRDTKSGNTFIFNEERAKKRLTPESTFKVPNALIGLQVGAVQDEYDIKRWDGIEREIDIWNQDHTLGSGMRHSVIWYYQAMARDIGTYRMTEWVHKLSYGNKDISGGINQFWLDSSLKISPLEQANFMERLYKETLPFNKPVINTVKRMMIQEEGNQYTLYGKTGTRLSDLRLGWFVGFIETENRSYVFVTNVAGSGTTAKNITMEILKKYRLITK